MVPTLREHQLEGERCGIHPGKDINDFCLRTVFDESQDKVQGGSQVVLALRSWLEPEEWA